ncbi:amidohydrolase family protein [Nocardioidaceae bacterium]|nr:amidohydrolase family protein [Nocardioidaceae bacterium]
MPFDTLIRGARWFDGTGGESAVRDIGLRDGHVAAVGIDLDADGCPDVVDAHGCWVTPGMVDIHTHYDVEVLEQPGLAESVRHGVTTVLVGSCSLSTVHVDPVTAGDLFGRVEAIPRQHVIKALETHGGWSTAAEYADALDTLPLGPNVATFIGHSDLRAAGMGLDRATRKGVRPTAAEQRTMERRLTAALEAGFVGMSAQELLFDKLDGDVARSRTLPSTYASRRERRGLNRLLRESGRVLQGGPDIASPVSIGAMTLGAVPLPWRRSGGEPLRTSLLSAADLKANPLLWRLMPLLAGAVNGGGGDFRWQHLPVPFEVYADGIDLVIFEELNAGAAALHLADQVERRTLLADEDYRARFRKEYDERFSMRVWHRDLFDAEIVDCPDADVIGMTFGEVGRQRGGAHPVDAYLDLVVEHGTKLRWRTTISNHRPKVLRRLGASDAVQLGFSDAGAHLRNMAFYNFGLRFLRHVLTAEADGVPFLTAERAVHRLTGELADWYGLEAGHLRVGDRADLVVIDPQALDDRLDDYAEATVPAYDGLSRIVNRNDDAVRRVMVAGQTVVEHGRPTDDLGSRRHGRFLRAS